MNYRTRKYVDLHVIDAIDKDFLAKWGPEAEMLRKALDGLPINIVAHSAVDATSLSKVIYDIRDYRATYAYPRHSVPYVHISCHGSKDALSLGEANDMTWSQFSEALLPLLATT